jgi:hypothetical protein
LIQLQQNSLIPETFAFLSSGIVTIPEVNLFKTSDQSWLLEDLDVEGLMYLHPFSFLMISFKTKLTKYQFPSLI